MGIIGWIVLGLIAGAIAKAILPGNQGGGWLMTLLLGVAALWYYFGFERRPDDERAVRLLRHADPLGDPRTPAC